MRCTFRAAAIMLCGLLLVLVATPVPTATAEEGTLELKPANGRPGDTYQLTGTAVPCEESYLLKFGESKPIALGRSTADTPTWTSIVPDLEPGQYTVELHCTEPVGVRVAAMLLAHATFEVLTPPVQTVDVPVLEGKNLPEAEQALADVGLMLGKVTGGMGTVIGQVPVAGTAVKPGDSVAIELSVLVVQVRVPNLIGRTVTEAEALLKPNGLKLLGATRNGRIATQDPESGTPVERGSSVRVTLRPIVTRPSPTPSPTPSPSPQSSSPTTSSVPPTPSLTSGGSPTVLPVVTKRSGPWILLGASGGAGGLLALAAAVLLSRTAIRARERQWIHKHVHAEPRLGDIEPPDVRTDPRFPTSAIRLELHQDPGTHDVEEVRR
jgi:hypothetical protein